MLADLTDILDRAFQQRIRQLMTEWHIPGVAVVLVPDEGEPVTYSFGERDHGLPVTPQTRFSVSSITKVVTAMALGKAWQIAGIASGFDTRVKDVLPEFALVNKEDEARCTVKDILAHKLNIPSYDNLVLRPLEKGETVLDRLSHVPQTMPMSDDMAKYSSLTQHVALPIIERLTDMAFEEFVQEAIFEPLGMSSTGFWARDTNNEMAAGFQTRRYAEGLRDGMLRVEHAFDKMGKDVGMASMRMITTSEDMGKFLQSLPGDPIWSQMSQPLAEFAKGAKEEIYGSDPVFGCGTHVAYQDGYKVVFHGGASAGFRTRMACMPELGVSMAVLTNSTEGWPLARYIQSCVIEKILGKEGYAEKQIDLLRAEIDTDLKAYVKDFGAIAKSGSEVIEGTFASPCFGSWTFTSESNLDLLPERTFIPWLPHLYGAVRPVVTSVGCGKFEGAFEFTPGEGQDDRFGVLYGYPFTVQVEDDEIHISGLSALGPEAKATDPPGVFCRVP